MWCDIDFQAADFYPFLQQKKKVLNVGIGAWKNAKFKDLTSTCIYLFTGKGNADQKVFPHSRKYATVRKWGLAF